MNTFRKIVEEACQKKDMQLLGIAADYLEEIGEHDMAEGLQTLIKQRTKLDMEFILEYLEEWKILSDLDNLEKDTRRISKEQQN